MQIFRYEHLSSFCNNSQRLKFECSVIHKIINTLSSKFVGFYFLKNIFVLQETKVKTLNISSTTPLIHAHVLTVQHNNFYMIYIQFASKQPQPQPFFCIYVRKFQKYKCSKRLENKYSTLNVAPKVQLIIILYLVSSCF